MSGATPRKPPGVRLIELPLQYGEALFARSAGGESVPCAPHPELPFFHLLDVARLPPGEAFHYVVRRLDGSERAERYFAHWPERGGPIDVWDGIRSIDSPAYVSELQERFQKHGFAVVPGVLSTDVLNGVDSIVRPLAETAWGRRGALVRDKINLEKVLICVPYLLQALAEKLAPVLTALVGPRVWLDYEQVMVVRAHTSYATRRHRDADGGRAPRSEASRRDKGSVHLWIPLVDIDETRACMYVEPLDAEGSPMNLPMRAGDALFLHNYVWHGAHANTSPEHRFSWLLNVAPHPSRDTGNPAADLNLLILKDGEPTDLGPEVCERRLLEQPGYLDLFGAYFTYDPHLGRMVNPDNRADGEPP